LAITPELECSTTFDWESKMKQNNSIDKNSNSSNGTIVKLFKSSICFLILWLFGWPDSTFGVLFFWAVGVMGVGYILEALNLLPTELP
jgi:phosphate/sulfate permease